MENIKFENEPRPKDISSEFTSMDSYDFRQFLRSQKDQPYLDIKINWVDVETARKLKAFLEDSSASKWNQKRTATIRATEKQKNQEINVFESGVVWEKI